MKRLLVALGLIWGFLSSTVRVNIHVIQPAYITLDRAVYAGPLLIGWRQWKQLYPPAPPDLLDRDTYFGPYLIGWKRGVYWPHPRD